MPQLPACPCWLSILLEAPGYRSQQGELEKWPPCLPWEAWEGSSLGNLPSLVLLLTERTWSRTQFVEQGYFLYYPNPGLGRAYILGGSFPLFWGFRLIIELEVITLHSRLLAGGSLYHCHYHNWRLLHSIAPKTVLCPPLPILVLCPAHFPALTKVYQPLLNGSWISDTGTSITHLLCDLGSPHSLFGSQCSHLTTGLGSSPTAPVSYFNGKTHQEPWRASPQTCGTSK